MMCIICGVRPAISESLVCMICEERIELIASPKVTTKLRSMKKVYDVLPADKFMPTSQVVEKTGFKPTTITLYLRELATLGLVEYKYSLNEKYRWSYAWRRK